MPSAPEYIAAEKSGEVYYSSPNRIMLFFGDAEKEGDFGMNINIKGHVTLNADVCMQNQVVLQ
ncbi:MAG: hypothetical protein IJ571_04765 [Ruminococcus sp.]|nr:hypothetical protein [Ruminococcus sp.]